MTRVITWIFVICICSISAAWAADQEPAIADTQEEIRPLLVGAHIPSVTLTSSDGTPVNLNEVVAKQPSILIFYRGGW